MPGPKKKLVKLFTEEFTTEGQRVTKDGSEVIMKNGKKFKRTVLPSSAYGLKSLDDGLDLLEDLDESEANSTEE